MVAPWWWRYAIPNIVTSASLLAGLMSISSAIAGEAESAAWFILLSVALDKADGTVARLLKGSSAFGMQMDSLTDLIVFGVAPAVLVFSVLLGTKPVVSFSWWQGLSTIAYVGTFWFVIASALRLAKFNVLSESYGKNYFFGIPTTLCGAIVAILVIMGLHYPSLRASLQVLPIVMIVLGFLMVSRVPLPKVRPGKTIFGKIWVFGNIAATYTCAIARVGIEYLLFVATVYLLVGSAVAMARGVKAPPLPRPGEEAGASAETA